MPSVRFAVMIVAAAVMAAGAGCGGGGDESNVTPGVTTTGLQTQVAGVVTPFPTPLVTGGVVDSSASKGYTATYPEGWTFYPNRIQTVDASVDVAFEPLTAGATAQANIAVECIVTDDPNTEAHVIFEATKTARIGTNSNIRTSQREISGVTATVLDYRFFSQNETSIPPLEKQDVIFSSGRCDWKITTTAPEGQRAQLEPLFNAFLESFQLAG